MRNAQPIIADRIRNIRDTSFGWVDHNFLHHGYLGQASPQELLLYYFLITVADRNGVSFYDYQRICQFLKLGVDEYIQARNRLNARSLIVFREGIFQVLPLSPQRRPDPAAARDELNSWGEQVHHRFNQAAGSAGRKSAAEGFRALRQILEDLNKQ